MKVNSLISILTTLFLVGVCQCVDIKTTWENVNYIRSIDLSRSYVKESCLIEAKNTNNKPQDEYFFTVNDGFGIVPNVSVISVSMVDQPVAIDAIEVEHGVYKLKLPAPVAPNSKVDLKVRYVYIDTLSPLPNKLAMDGTQHLLVKLNKFAYSPYLTKTYTMTFTGILKGQEMELHLAGNQGHEFTENAPELKPKVEHKSLVYGPLLTDLQPYTVKPMGLLYEHNRPLAKVNNLERSVWVPASNTNNLAIEEYYELTNNAAELSTGFLRVDWMQGKYETTRNHWALSHLQFPYTDINQFEDYYFTDLVGMVSTHSVSLNNLFLRPRFPLFGGWNYNFTLGWNNQIKNYIHKLNDEPDTYIVKFPLLNSIKDITYENVSLNFYLPESAELVNVSSPIEFSSIEVGNELSYLDVSKGHIKVTLKYNNIFDDLSNIDVLLMFKYTQVNYWWKVMKISGFIFIGLTSYYLLSLIDVSIDKKDK